MIYKTRDFLGVLYSCPCWTRYITLDSDHRVWAFECKPSLIAGRWDVLIGEYTELSPTGKVKPQILEVD